MELTELPNIGKVLADRLRGVNISSAEELQLTGAEKAFLLLQAVDPTTCINTLYALEGGIQNIRWHNLDRYRKDELLLFFRHNQNSLG